jgi:adenylosuccinate lyase
VAASAEVKEHGRRNDLVDRIAADPAFAAVHALLPSLLDPALHVGRAPEQVREFLDEEVAPALAPWRDRMTRGAGLRV